MGSSFFCSPPFEIGEAKWSPPGPEDSYKNNKATKENKRYILVSIRLHGHKCSKLAVNSNKKKIFDILRLTFLGNAYT